MKVEVWERQPGESPKAYRAFCTYRDLGIDRTLAKAAALLGNDPKWFEQLSSRHKWVNRCKAYDQHIDHLLLTKMEQDAIKVKRASLTASMKMVALGLQRLDTMDASELTTREAKEYIRNAVAIVQVLFGESETAQNQILEMPNDNDVVVYLPEIERKETQDDEK